MDKDQAEKGENSERTNLYAKIQKTRKRTCANHFPIYGRNGPNKVLDKLDRITENAK